MRRVAALVFATTLLAALDAPAAPAQKSSLRIARGSQVIAQVGEGGLSFLLVFLLQHDSVAPYGLPAEGLRLKLPRGARNVELPQGSEKIGRLNAAKDTLVLQGPLPPGGAQVQLSFDIMAESGRLPFQMVLPLPLEGAIFAITPNIHARVSGPNVVGHEVRRHQGASISITRLAPLRAGGVLDLQVEGLPARDQRPMLVALTLAALIAVWAAYAAATSRVHLRRRERRRERLLEELVSLRRRRDAGELDDDAHDARAAPLRRELQKAWPESP